MPLIRSISDLRNKANEIAELCHRQDQPVFITKNGAGDLVVMSQAHYERMEARLEIYKKLDEAEALHLAGDKGISHAEMMKRLKSRLK